MIPVWLMAAVVIRDVVIIAGATIFRWLHGPYMMSPSKAGKFSTFLQILLVVWLLVEQAFALESTMISVILIWLTLVVTVASGLEYILVWFKKSKEMTKAS